MEHNPQPTTIAILGCDTVVGRSISVLLEGSGYRTTLLDSYPTGIVDELLEGAHLLILTPRVDYGVREAFDYDYEEIASIVGKSETNCRQIARRARQSLAARRPRFERSLEKEKRLTERFVEACMSGDIEGLLEILSEDVTLWSDGGGKVAAAPYPIYGSEKVARFLVGVLRTVPPGFFANPARINGGPGVVGYVDGRSTGWWRSTSRRTGSVGSA